MPADRFKDMATETESVHRPDSRPLSVPTLALRGMANVSVGLDSDSRKTSIKMATTMF